MKLSEALKIINSARDLASVKEYNLICGFSPLHLQTFMTALLQQNNLIAKVVVNVGIFGDIIGNLLNSKEGADSLIFLEWSDFDQRLSARSLPGWSKEVCNDIELSFVHKLKLFSEVLNKRVGQNNITISLPLLPILPLDYNSPLQYSSFSLNLKRAIFDFASSISKLNGVKIINQELITGQLSAPIYDFKGELDFGFPYTKEGAYFIADATAQVLSNSQPKKGIITDLDNTCWKGILGDDGLTGITWTLEDKSQGYGLYQQLLKSLSLSGVLVGIASKNDTALVNDALNLSGMILKSDDVFPVEANWGRKSESIARIIKQWNISSADVVFIDDNPFEIEEVKVAFPDMECLLYPSEPTHVYSLLLEIRKLFGRNEIFEEDIIRSNSIKNAGNFAQSNIIEISEEDLLQGLNAKMVLSIQNEFTADRSLELVNKTNQFNLNGLRFELGDWAKLNNQNRFLGVAEYMDKFGPLGRISVLSGYRDSERLIIDIWVLSCRAFSRRIEYSIINMLFAKFDVDEIVFMAKQTQKNKLVYSLFDSLELSVNDDHQYSLNRATFYQQCPKLYSSETIK